MVVRAAFASCVMLAILFLVSGAALLNCPFLKDPNSHLPCCPRQSSEKQGKCPLSKSLDSCALYTTEAKIGRAESPGPSVQAPLIDASTPAVIALTEGLPERSDAWSPDSTDLHVRLRVFRI